METPTTFKNEKPPFIAPSQFDLFTRWSSDRLLFAQVNFYYNLLGQIITSQYIRFENHLVNKYVTIELCLDRNVPSMK